MHTVTTSQPYEYIKDHNFSSWNWQWIECYPPHNWKWPIHTVLSDYPYQSISSAPYLHHSRRDCPRALRQSGKQRWLDLSESQDPIWGCLVKPFFFQKNIYLLIWLFWVLDAARGIFIVSYGIFHCGPQTIELQCAGLAALRHVGP